MMHIADELVHTTIRIETNGPEGSGSGTGFFMNMRDDGQSRVPIIVTNKHVIRNSTQATFRFTRANRLDGSPDIGNILEYTVSGDNHRWIFHEDDNIDLAAFPLAPILDHFASRGAPIFYKAFQSKDVADDKISGSMTSIEDVIMIGYPNGIWDSENNLPIVRRGVTATPPQYGFEGKREFVIDCACFPGSSGSPVILYNPSGYYDKNRSSFVHESRAKLLGILWGGPQFSAVGKIVVLPIPTQAEAKEAVFSRIPMNLGFCIRATELFWFDRQFKLALKNRKEEE